MIKVAFLGTGTMGHGLATNAVRAGIPTVVWNREPEATRDLAELGADVAETAAGAARRADIVVTMVTDADAVMSIAHDQGMLGALAPGTIWAQMSTIGVSGIERVAAMVLDSSERQSRPLHRSAGVDEWTKVLEPLGLLARQRSLDRLGPRVGGRVGRDLHQSIPARHPRVGRAPTPLTCRGGSSMFIDSTRHARQPNEDAGVENIAVTLRPWVGDVQTARSQISTSDTRWGLLVAVGCLRAGREIGWASEFCRHP
jgi:hypothetical protein